MSFVRHMINDVHYLLRRNCRVFTHCSEERSVEFTMSPGMSATGAGYSLQGRSRFVRRGPWFASPFHLGHWFMEQQRYTNVWFC
jgi:hypothetical protein